MTNPPKDVDSYIAAAPPAARKMLKRMRSAVKSAAPKAEEKLSYGMPYYGYKGRLVYFAAFKNHIGFYAWGPVMKTYAKEIEKYRAAKSTLQFPIGTEIPATLVRKLVKARVKENEMIAKAKGKS